ncbi:hypothetical protein EBB07_02055 [Paenibacillaceae bacterium]|nr:hypothetical protein EBB07_02055 [Paenibacillaceae bacterium]
MLKFMKEQYKGMVVGFLTFALFASLLGTAVAAGKVTSINVIKGGIKLFIDGKHVVPTDESGKEVEPFLYEGTTYLPLRALTNALTNNEKPVTWDSKTSSIYIGQAQGPASSSVIDISQLPLHVGYSENITKGSKASFHLLDKVVTPTNRFTSGVNYTYQLDNKYSELQAKLVVPYTKAGNKAKGGIQFFNVNKKGEEILLQEHSTVAGIEPLKITVDLQGIEMLRIRTYLTGVGSNAVLYDVMLTTK